MDLAKLQKMIEAGPREIERIITSIERSQKAARTTEFVLEAVRLLRVSWKDEDPGKHTAHWYGFKDGRKAWPRELVEGVGERSPDPAKLCDFAELDRKPCPACETPGLEVERYEQEEDTPEGDLWTKTRYVMCAECRGLHRLGEPRRSDGRF